jgi:PD-(D/E)XK endonuclease
MVMSLGVLVGDLFGSVEVEDLLASAARDKGGMARFTGKRRGEMAEAAFVAKAVSLGFGVAKPWGDSDPFDFIVQSGGKLLKVQVKSAHCVGEDGTYSIRTHGHDMKAYRVDQIDVLVV